MALVLDTSALLAALDAADPDHEQCATLIAGSSEELVVPELVLGELDYWCHERLTAQVWLQSTYADLKVGVVDASVMAAVERLDEAKLATLDHRHFGTMRPQHVVALELLPTGS